MIDGVDSSEAVARVPITAETKEWSRDLDIVSPVNTADIPGFQSWVNWCGLGVDTGGGRIHTGHDFAAYVNQDGEIVFGLPGGLAVRAVADGKIGYVMRFPNKAAYSSFIEIEHNVNSPMAGVVSAGLLSSYNHVVPLPELEEGREIKKGDILGELYKDPNGDEGRLVHLHFELWNWDSFKMSAPKDLARAADPAQILGSAGLGRLVVEPQGSAHFTVPQFPTSSIKIANFKTVKVN